MPKDNQYWQVYNQKRKAYLAAKKKASRQRLKGLSTITLNSPWLTTPKKVADHQTTDVLMVVDQVVDTQTVVDKRMVVDNRSQVVDINQTASHQTVVDNSFQVVDNLSHLIQSWQTNTAYNCASTCSLNKYCSNCWYFQNNQLIDYKKEVLM